MAITIEIFTDGSIIKINVVSTFEIVAETIGFYILTIQAELSR